MLTIELEDLKNLIKSSVIFTDLTYLNIFNDKDGLHFRSHSELIGFEFILHKNKPDEEIDTFISFNQLLAILKGLPDYLALEFNFHTTHLLIKTDNSEYSLEYLDAIEYPKINLINTKKPVILSESIIRKAKEATKFASKDVNRLALTYTLLNKQGLVATDGFKIYWRAIKKITGKQQILLHKDICKYLSILPSNYGNKLTYSASDRFDILDYLDENFSFKVFSLKCSVDYPSWSHVLPKEEDSHITFKIEKGHLLEVINRTQTLYKQDKSSTRNNIEFFLTEEKQLCVQCQKSTHIVPIQSKTHNLTFKRFQLNRDYVVTLLSVWEASYITLNIYEGFVLFNSKKSDLLIIIFLLY